jgi:ppGpp synthetase/RelA/SpoT-type nucleotidyltranferase
MMQNDISLVDLQDDEELLSEINMAWTRPQYSRNEVNNAGKLILRKPSFIKDTDIQEWVESMHKAVDIINNFRLAHYFPLTIIRNALHNKAQTVDRQNITAQRLKRFPAIHAKLERFERMELWDMQDIGGCRAIVQTVDNVCQLAEMLKASGMHHRLTHEDDYIQQPRDSGYRSRHLIYRYHSDKNEIFNGFKIEIQIRTPLQHAWATAVETVDLFTQQGLKSDKGQANWRRFFQLMGTWMAFRENTPLVQTTPTDRPKLAKELAKYANSLQVKARLEGFTNALKLIGDVVPKKRGYILLSLDITTDTLTIDSYGRNEFQLASNDLELREEEIRKEPGKNAVLVTVDSTSNLRRAYPNYFADTRLFIQELERALRS